MERNMKYGFVVLAMFLMSLRGYAQPTTIDDNETDPKLPPLIFPKENVTIGSGLPPLVFPTENVIIGSGLPPLVFPTENVTIGSGLPPLIFPTENVTIGDSLIPIKKVAEAPIDKIESLEEPPLIFPENNVSVPLIKLPPLLFPDDSATSVNKTALDILNAAGSTPKEDMHILPSLDDDYYKDDSNESSDSDEISDDVEEVQTIDDSPQKDNLEENYKTENRLPYISDFDDIDVDHPTLKNAHVLSIVAVVLIALCSFIYLGITIWRRLVFNKYGMRERLINEEDYYMNKNIPYNF
ncbi:hypothetical protein Bhyg_12824 [Pseudolycoriella hygida]|uniref:Uncharacterized protein n=1 Tax=Pseudolycoriella hygida TaxID=35572 RepID=A0A9Q0MY61_9DIPT|nr:hypothetical protein Bhyg_12824 [Pseudolycoriella hygida]